MDTKQILEAMDNAHAVLLGTYIENAPSTLRKAKNEVARKLAAHDELVAALKVLAAIPLHIDRGDDTMIVSIDGAPITYGAVRAARAALARAGAA